MNLRNLVIGALCLSGLMAQAQTRQLTLEEAVAVSLQNNYDIQLTRNDSMLAALDYAYANYALLPRLNAGGGYLINNNNQKQELANGTHRGGDLRSRNLSASLNLDWILFDGLRMFIARDRLGELAELGELQVKNQVVTTVADVMRLYYDIVRQEQQLRAIEEQIELSEERLRLAQYKFEVGTGAKPDALQAQIDLNAQKTALLIQQTNINKTKEQLNQLLVIPVNTIITVADTSITVNENILLDSIQSGIAGINPELLIAQKNLDIANLSLKEQKAQGFPTIEFNSAYIFNRTKNQSVVNEVTQPLLNRNAGFNYGITATVPIFNGLNNRRLIKAAQLNIDYQKLLYQRSLSQITTNVANAYKDYDLYKRTLKLEEDNMKLVRENLMIARERYRLGVSTFLEMREAQQSLAAAATRLIQASFNTKIAEIELLRLRGDIVR